MRILSWLVLLYLLVSSLVPICYAETAETSGRFSNFSWTTLIINIVITLILWRLIMMILHRFSKPKKIKRKK